MIKRLEWKKKPRGFFFPSIFLGEGGGGGGGGGVECDLLG